MSNFKLFVLLLVVLVASGCTVTYPVVGQFDDFNEVVHGEIDHDLIAGTALIRVEAEQTDFRCSGTSRVLHVPASNYIIPGRCKGQKGDAHLDCSDGRLVKADWEALSCTQGFGAGFDQDGARFSFTFGMNEDEALEYIEQARADVADKPQLPGYRPKETREREGFATGTGFFVSKEGHIVTNFHVIEDSSNVTITWGGSDYEATVLKLDRANDVALIKIEAETPALSVASASSIRRGQDVMTLGYPLVALQGQSQKASFGRVNSLSGIQDDIRFIQIDVPVQPGNSGGPLLDNEGNVVGVVTATLNQLVTLRESGTLPQNVNYAVKSDYVIPLLPDSKEVVIDGRPDEFPDIVLKKESAIVLVVTR